MKILSFETNIIVVINNSLLQINVEKRLQYNKIFNSYLSIDGTDCRIEEPAPFNTCWYSHKFKGAGLRYEIGVSLLGGNIMWANGPFPCGSYPDVKIFRNELKHLLLEDEYVIADKGYRDEKCMIERIERKENQKLQNYRARHETINRMLKSFNVLSTTFRHDRNLHSDCFHAVCNIVNLKIKHGDIHPYYVL